MSSLTIYLGSLPLQTGMFGPGLTDPGLGNLQIGGPDGLVTRKVAYKFKAPVSSNLSSVRIYTAGGGGYAGGTGGTIEVTVQADSSGAPSGSALSTQSFTGSPGADTYPLVTFGSPAAVTAASWYWLVFRNTDAAPHTNWVSVDCIYITPAPTPPAHPAYPDWGTVLLSEKGDWTDTVAKTTFTGIASLNFSDSSSYGFGWLGRAAGNQTLSAAQPLREVITSTLTRTVKTVGLWTKLSSGTDPLTVTLQDSNGSTIDSVSFTAASLTTANDGVWVTANFASSWLLIGGTRFYLELSTAGTTQYSVAVPYDGADSGFAAVSCFTEGYTQKYTGGTWSTWAGAHAHWPWYMTG